MRILVTGPLANCTDKKYNATRSRTSVFTTSDGLISILEELGHQVTVKSIIPGEDISMYDDALVIMAGMFTNLSSFTPGVLWTFHKFPNAKVTVNDWRVRTAVATMKSSFNFDKIEDVAWFKSFLQKNNETVSKLNKADDVYSLSMKYKDELSAALVHIKKSQNVVLFPAYNSFRRDLLDVDNPVVRYNPEEFMPQRDYKPFSLFADAKDRKHVIACASKPDWKWYSKLYPAWEAPNQSTGKWKLALFGNWSKEYGGIQVKEEDLTRVISDSYSCVVPSYSQIRGVGMWRPRHRLCYNTSTLIICDKHEAALFGEGYGTDVATIEQMSDSQLSDMIEVQRTSFAKTFEDRQHTLEIIQKCFEG